MRDLEDRIRQALERGDPVPFEHEESLRQMIVQTFRSRLKLMVVFLWIEALAVCGVAIWSAIELYRAQETKPLIVWSTALVISAIFFVLVKVVGWQWMNKYALMREIKRLELQVAALAARLGEDGPARGEQGR